MNPETSSLESQEHPTSGLYTVRIIHGQTRDKITVNEINWMMERQPTFPSFKETQTNKTNEQIETKMIGSVVYSITPREWQSHNLGIWRIVAYGLIRDCVLESLPWGPVSSYWINILNDVSQHSISQRGNIYIYSVPLGLLYTRRRVCAFLIPFFFHR